jgi:hypothetical protein
MCTNRAGVVVVLPLLLLAAAGGSAVGLPVAIDHAMGNSITPSHALYGLERAGEAIELAMASDQAQLHLDLAAERAAEAQAEHAQGHSEYVQALLDEYREHLAAAVDELVTAAQNGGDVQAEVAGVVEVATSIHNGVLTELASDDHLPEEAQDAVAAAAEASVGAEHAVNAIQDAGSDEHPAPPVTTPPVETPDAAHVPETPGPPAE